MSMSEQHHIKVSNLVVMAMITICRLNAFKVLYEDCDDNISAACDYILKKTQLPQNPSNLYRYWHHVAI